MLILKVALQETFLVIFPWFFPTNFQKSRFCKKEGSRDDLETIWAPKRLQNGTPKRQKNVKKPLVFQKFRFKRPKGREFSLAGRYVYEDRWGGQMNWSAKYRGGDQVYGESIYTARIEAFGNYQFNSNLSLRKRVPGQC